MFDFPARASRPTRRFDGQGGSVETLSGSPTTLWCDPAISDGELTVTCDARVDVRIGDLVELPHQIDIQYPEDDS
jgi:hypothetical protein